jgi:type I restriction enzyme S subunit
VTRGLDPTVRRRHSGIDWLGDIPEHWVAPHLRYLVRCLDGTRIPMNAVQRGALQGDVPYWGANTVIDHVSNWLFDEHLVLLGEDGAPFFEPGRDVAFFVSGKIWVNNHAHVLRCGSRLLPRYLVHVLNCVDYIGFVDGSTRDKLTQQGMGSIPIQLPPVAEQAAIVSYIDEQTSVLTCAATTADRQIELLREYRTRLIADVVTGKLDVLEAASQLPDQVGEPELLDDSDALEEGDESEDEMDLDGAAGEVEA